MSELDLTEKIEYLKVDELIPFDNNPKKHPDEQVKKIADSILEFGFTVPMIVDKDNRIIAGHGRYKAIDKHLDIEEVPVIRRDDLTDAQAKALRLADNRITIETTWDMEKLGIELEQLDDLDFDLEKTGFEDNELEPFNEDIGEEGNDARSEWDKHEDLPDYEADDIRPEYSIKVHFRTEEDIKDFAELVDQTVTKDTKYIYYPEQEIQKVDHLEWKNEKEPESKPKEEVRDEK